MARTIGLEFQTEEFVKAQRCLTLNYYIWSSEDILKNGLELLKQLMPTKPCRMI